MLTCAINVSEGRDLAVLDALSAAGGADLLDRHVDAHHHRTVLTTVGEQAARRIACVAVEAIDLQDHEGVHPCFGAVDVVPFVALDETPVAEARSARDRFADWIARTLAVPAFCYSEEDGEPNLPEVRRRAFVDLAPDRGPAGPHPTAGAVAVGCRPPLVAYNLWLAEPDLDRARAVATAVRGDGIRALGLAVGDRVQVSMNLVEPFRVGPATAYDRVAAEVAVVGAELVGLLPRRVLEAIPPERWATLDVAEDRTVESRLGR